MLVCVLVVCVGVCVLVVCVGGGVCVHVGVCVGGVYVLVGYMCVYVCVGGVCVRVLVCMCGGVFACWWVMFGKRVWVLPVPLTVPWAQRRRGSYACVSSCR